MMMRRAFDAAAATMFADAPATAASRLAMRQICLPPYARYACAAVRHAAAMLFSRCRLRHR